MNKWLVIGIAVLAFLMLSRKGTTPSPTYRHGLPDWVKTHVEAQAGGFVTSVQGANGEWLYRFPDGALLTQREANAVFGILG